jgi:prolyl oligopeptidase
MNRPSVAASNALLLLVLAVAFAARGGEPPGPPTTARRPVVDTYHGESVIDPYQWLEHVDTAEVRTWTEQQNAFTRRILDAAPARAAIADQLRKILREGSPRYANLRRRGDRWLALKLDPRKNQPMLVTLSRLDGQRKEHVVLDPNELDPSGSTVIDFYQATLDGARVAVSLSRKGTESGDVHVYDVPSGEERTGDLVPRVNGGTAGGSVAWTRDGTGFFYTRYPREERPPEDRAFYQQVYFHRLGRPTAEDRYEVGRDFPRIAEITLETSPGGRWVLASVKDGDGGDVAHHLRRADGSWILLAAVADRIREAHFGLDGALYLRSLKDAEHGRILRLEPGQPLRSATVSAPEGESSIEEFVATRTRLYISNVHGGPEEIRVFDHQGRPLGSVPIPPVASAEELTPTQVGDDLYVRVIELTRPAVWYRIFAGGTRSEPTALRVRSPADLSRFEVTREVAISRDGTEIPMTIVRARSVPRDGTAPGILTGYGGYGISLKPRFLGDYAPWLEQGGVLVGANVRGGGEFGDAWHRAGALTHKQNVFDDFQACARALIDRKHVAAGRLGIEGGSNGGLLMGAALTQAPQLYRAVVSHVGIYDMLRVERGPNGAFNVTEFGTVKDPDQYRALRAYSPYHHVVDGTAYPAVLLMTGLNDPRVEPMQSFKMAARLQEATSSGRPVLLRVSDSGHGIGSGVEERIAVRIDSLVFFFSELGLPFRPQPSAAPPR